jgi:hypothetical protein
MGNTACRWMLIPLFKPCACDTCDKDGKPRLDYPDRRAPPPSPIGQIPALETTPVEVAREQILAMPWELPAGRYSPWDDQKLKRLEEAASSIVVEQSSPPSPIGQVPALRTTPVEVAREQVMKMPWELPGPGYYPWDDRLLKSLEEAASSIVLEQ